MDSYELTYIDKPHHGDKWRFQVDGPNARLVRPDGQPAAHFTPDEAFQSIELLNFAKSGHNIAITVANQELHFTGWPKAFKGLRAFTELSPLAASDTILSSLRNRGWLQTIIGAILFSGGTILSLDGLLQLTGHSSGGGEHYVFYGAMVIGALCLYKGWWYFSEARRLEKSSAA
jgi:hypothetical protein